MLKAQFDPGFAPYVEHFSQNIQICTQIFSSMSSVHQKKFKYKVLYPQIISLIKNNVAFYYGCLLWAFVLMNENKENPLEIEGNSFLNMTDEDISKYDFLEEINFIIDYLPILDKDSKYYLGKSSNLPLFWKQILLLYKEFLELNNGFVKVSRTSDIKLPDAFLDIKYSETIKQKVEDSIRIGSIETLLDYNIFA